MSVFDELTAALHDEVRWYDIPEYMREAVARYVLYGDRPGHFLSMVFSNDLMGALGRADDQNRDALPSYGFFLYNVAPSDCYGSKAKFEAWIAKSGLTVPPITSEAGFDGSGRMSDFSLGHRDNFGMNTGEEA